MAIQIIPKERQGSGAFNGGEIIENHPIGFPQNGGEIKPYSNLFYWAHAKAKVDSTIGLHPHQGFEIMSFILKGHIRHYDTKLKEWRQLEAGDVQIIRAGNGISHAEFMAEGAEMFQIWVDPNLGKTLNQPASYNDYKSSELPVVKDGDIDFKNYAGGGSKFQMDTEGMEIQELNFEKANFQKNISEDFIYSIYVIEGDLKINSQEAKTTDFIIISNAKELNIQSEKPGKLFMITSPKQLNYQTYAEMMQARHRN